MTTRVLGRLFGVLVVVSILAGCAGTGSSAGNGSITNTQFTQDDECRRAGGFWTGTVCTFAGAGGGGGY